MLAAAGAGGAGFEHLIALLQPKYND